MFLATSRYAKTPTDTVTTDDGRDVTALRLRRLPTLAGDPVMVREGDRLDVQAQARFGDATKAWHIGDANSALETKDLVARILSTYNLPRS